MKLRQITLFLLASVLILVGCREDFEDLEYGDWKPITAIPLVNSTITVDDVLTELNHPEEVLILDDGVVALNYKGELFSFNASDILEIPNQNFTETLTLTQSEADDLEMFGTLDPSPANYAFNLDLDPLEASVSEIKFLSGTLEFSLTREQDENFSGTVSIEQLTDENGNIPEIIFNGDQPVGQAETVALDISGYKLNPLIEFDNQINFVADVSYENNTMNTAMGGDFITAGLVIEDVQFEHIIGDFGDVSLSEDVETVSVDLFRNVEEGSFALTNPSFELFITNSFGFPAEIDLGNITATNENSGDVTNLNLGVIDLEGQAELGGLPEEATFEFNESTGLDVSSFFQPAPLLVDFDIAATANPDGSPPPNDLNFITNESSFKVDIDVILPLEGYVLDLGVRDTVALGLSFEQYEQIDSIEFRLEMLNTFPLGVAFQAYFLDSLNTVTDSLFMDQVMVMEAAMTDSDGNVTGPTSAVNFIALDAERSENLQRTKSVEIKALFDTPNSENGDVIRIKETQEVDLKLGAKIFGNIEL